MGKKEEDKNTNKDSELENMSQLKSETESNITRMVVLKESDKIANEVQDLVNDGFEAGRATKLDVISFIFQWFKNNITDDVIHQIRISCTDELTMLENVLKKAKSSGNLPPDLKSALAQHFFGNATVQPRKSKKPLKHDSINDTNKESEAS